MQLFGRVLVVLRKWGERNLGVSENLQFGPKTPRLKQRVPDFDLGR